MRSAYFMLLVSELVSLLLWHLKASISIISIELLSSLKNLGNILVDLGLTLVKVSEVIMLIMKNLFLTSLRTGIKDAR